MNQTNTFIIFNEDAFRNLSQSEKHVKLRHYFQLFNNRKALYDKVGGELYDVNSIQVFTETYQQFLEKYPLWHKQTHHVIESGDIDESFQKLKDGNNLFEPMEKTLYKLKPTYSLDLNSIEDIKNTLSDTFNINAAEYTDSIAKKIDDGIQKLYDVKVEQDIRHTFSRDVKNAIIFYNIGRVLSLLAFIITILFLMGGLLSTYLEPKISYFGYSLSVAGAGDYSGFALRLSIALPLIWMAYLFNNLYKYYHVAAAKFDHLNRLLHDGSRSIIELLDNDEVAIALTRKRLSELFLEIDDTTNIVTTAKHPNEKALKIVTKALSSLRKDINELKH